MLELRPQRLQRLHPRRGAERVRALRRGDQRGAAARRSASRPGARSPSTSSAAAALRRRRDEPDPRRRPRAEARPATDGTVEILGGPCPGGGCSVAPPRSPHGPDHVLGALPQRSRCSAISARPAAPRGSTLDEVEAFAPDTIDGTGNGRRRSDGLAVNAQNATPLGLGVDWAGTRATSREPRRRPSTARRPTGKCQGDGSASAPPTPPTATTRRPVRVRRTTSRA